MINKVTLIGNVGGDPEIKSFDGGNSLARFSLATSENYKDKNGEWQQKTEWHTIVAWGALAEKAHSNLRKGTTLYLEGKLTHRSWEDNDGNKRYATEVVANYFRTIRKAEQENNNGGAQKAQHQNDGATPEQANIYAGTTTGPIGSNSSAADDDLPF